MKSPERKSIFLKLVLEIFIIVFGLLPFSGNAQSGSIIFDDTDSELMTLSNNYYEVGLSKIAGAIDFIIDKSSGDTLTTGSRDEALWQVSFRFKDHWGQPDMKYIDQCSFHYSWDNNSSTLSLNYTPQNNDTSLAVTVTVIATAESYFDMKMTMTNNSDPVVKTVWFPNHLKMYLDETSEALVPLSYPGTLLEGGFFKKHTSFLDYYPGLFLADYMGFKISNSNIAIYTLRDGLPVRFTYTGITPYDTEMWHEIEKNHFFYVHQYPIYTEKDSVWVSPVTRFYFNKSYVETLKNYRSDNNLDSFPSLQAKLGDKFEKFTKSPWMYKIFEHGWSNFKDFGNEAKDYFNPALLLVTGSNIGGFDLGQWPDVKPDPNLGTNEEFINMIKNYVDNDVSVMLFSLLPVLNENSDTYQRILSKATLEDVVGVKEDSTLKENPYGEGGRSYTITPQSPYMQEQFDRIFNTVFDTYGCDMIYEDGVGAGGDPYDFNKYAPGPLDNKQGWLDHTRRYQNYIQIVEAGYDRMAETVEGFMGSTYGMKWFGTEDRYNNGVWSYFPANTILFHDKVLPFHFWGVKTHSKHALSWNLAYGCQLHTDMGITREGDNLRERPWTVVVFDFQRYVRSRIIGKQMTSYSNLTGDVVQSVFDDITVIFNRDTTSSYTYGKNAISPDGNLVMSSNGDLVAGVFTEFNDQQFTDGDHYLIVENKPDTIFVRQPMGNDTQLKINMLSGWVESDSIWAVAFDSDDKLLEAFSPSLNNNVITFMYRETVQGQHVAYYKMFKSLTRPQADWDYIFNDFWRDKIIMGNQHYEIGLKRPTCDLLYILDKSSRDTLSKVGTVPIWQAEYPHAPEFQQFVNSSHVDNDQDVLDYTYSWSNETKVLHWYYETTSDTTRNVLATLTIDISKDEYFDMQVSLTNHWNYPIERISFPGDLLFDFNDNDNVTIPLSYPGVKVNTGFFQEGNYFGPVYPGLLKADYTAFNIKGNDMAVYSVNESTFVNPVNNIFQHPWNSKSNVTFQHKYLVNLENDSSWASPIIRFRIGQPFEQTIEYYREENHIDQYEDLITKLTDNFKDLTKSALFYSGFGNAVHEYSQAADILSVIPNPSLILLDNFTEGGGGYYQYHPDYAPKSQWGTPEEFKTMIKVIQGQGKLVMPYTMPSWWNENSPTVQNLTGSPGINDISYLDFDGNLFNPYGTSGFLVSPFHPFVKQRLSEMVNNLKSDLGFDIIYEYLQNESDAVLDFNDSAPSHRSYKQGWLEHTELYRDSALIVDGGYDRLAENVLGFTGTVFTAVGNESHWDMVFGSGNWEPYPVAPYLYHDKVMQYPDFEQFINNKDALSWCLLYGCNLNFYLNHWSGNSGIESPWVKVVSDFQKYVASRTTGKRMTQFVEQSENILKSTFSDITIIRNSDETVPFSINSHTIPPKGILVVSDNGDLIAGVFTVFNGSSLSSGDHYLIVQENEDTIFVHQPLGNNTEINIIKPANWTDNSRIHIYGKLESRFQEVDASINDSFMLFNLKDSISGSHVLNYIIVYGTESYELTEDIEICEGESYKGWNTTGQYVEYLTSITGGDSIVITNLTVNPVYEVIVDTVICKGESYKGWTEEGQYVESFNTVQGCDSIFIFNLAVNPGYEIVEYMTICDGESYNGWTETGQYQRTLVSQSGCDSIVTTNLIVSLAKETTENITICDGDSYKGWSAEGQYSETLTSKSGCDSIVTTNLSIYPSYQPEIVVKGDTLISANNYQAYRWYDENGEITGASEDEYVIDKSGDYHLIITDDNGCSNTSAVVNAVYSTIPLITLNGFKYTIIPNPNTGIFTFRIDSNPEYEISLKLVNAVGQVIEVREVGYPLINHIEQFDVAHLSKGIYHLIILTGNNQKSEEIIVQ